MRFNELDTLLLLSILQEKNSATIKILIEKIQGNEYIKGRLLNQLYNEITKNIAIQIAETQEFQQLIKKIKFKATPR